MKAWQTTALVGSGGVAATGLALGAGPDVLVRMWQMHLSTFTVCVGGTLLFAFLVLLAGHQLGGFGKCHLSCAVACVTDTFGGLLNV